MRDTTFDPPRDGLNDNGDEMTAAEIWFARMNSGTPASHECEAAFHAWLHADVRHGQAYRECQEVWMELGLGAGAPRILSLRSDALRKASAPSRRHLLFGLGSGAAAAVAGAGVWVAAGPSAARALIVTREGQRLTAPLPDGSRVTLAPMSRVRLRYSRHRRALTLEEGQAYFEVVHDTDRPFVVDAGDRQVTATGTRFQVTLTGPGDRASAEVVLEAGGVDVASRTAPSKRIRLKPGQSLSGHGNASVQPVDIATRTAWRDGRLVVQDRPLAEVVADFNRYSGDRLELGDEVTGRLRVSGSFRYDGAHEFALALEGSFGLRVRKIHAAAWRIDAPDSGTTVP